MPIISVIIPAYNAELTILETIASVQQQTLSDFELIVINDGSTDKTLELLGTVQDPRLKIYSYSNGGLPVARNRGIYNAIGDFISFLDADDLWTSDKLEKQLAALQKHPEAGVAYSWTCNMAEKGDSFYPGQSVSFEGNVYAKLLVGGNFISSGSNCLIRRLAIESVGEFDFALRSCEDWDFYLRLAARWPFIVVPKHQILYRQSSGAMSSKIDVMEKYALIVLERAFKAAPPELQSLKNQSLSTLYQYLAGMYLARITKGDEVRQAGHKLQMSIRLYPQTLFTKTTQRYVLKWLMMQILSPKIAKYFTRPMGMVNAISDPRMQ